jgi:TPR repeat protein
MWVQAFVRACVRACRCYRDGLGVRADKARMFAWFDAAARQGHALAQA